MMIMKPILPVLALLSIVDNGVVSAVDGSAKASKKEGAVSSAKAFKDGKASKMAKKSKEGGEVDAKAEKVGKASKSKAGKMFKSKKQGSKSSGPAPSAPTTTTPPVAVDPANYRSEYLDPSYWHPKTKNFEIIDWDKWEANCGDSVPFTYDPPFRATFTQKVFTGPTQWGRLGNLPEEEIATGAKPNIGYASDPDYKLFYGILGQAPDPSLVPEPLRNKLLWMEENVVSEYMNSFNRAAWRHNTEEGRVTGLFLTGDDYTVATHEIGFVTAPAAANTFVNFQASPDGKWIKFFKIPDDPNDPEQESKWFDMYIVQEGDVFTDRDGKVLDYVQPGDIYRLEFEDKIDPYVCSYTTYQYFMRAVATIDEETGVITPNQPHYDDMMNAVLNEPSDEFKEMTKNYTDESMMTSQDRWDFLTTYEPDRQMYMSSPPPPPASLLDDL